MRAFSFVHTFHFGTFSTSVLTCEISKINQKYKIFVHLFALLVFFIPNRIIYNVLKTLNSEKNNLLSDFEAKSLNALQILAYVTMRERTERIHLVGS